MYRLSPPPPSPPTSPHPPYSQLYTHTYTFFRLTQRSTVSELFKHSDCVLRGRDVERSPHNFVAFWRRCVAVLELIWHQCRPVQPLISQLRLVQPSSSGTCHRHRNNVSLDVIGFLKTFLFSQYFHPN